MQVSFSSFVEEFKYRLQCFTGVPPHNIKVLTVGKELKDHKSLNNLD